ncbi:MAG TPA: thiosulfate oxidation carrier protein SoxY [Burkholderiales bacterium]
MNRQRREILKKGGGLALFGALVAAGVLRPSDVRAVEWNKEAFQSKTLADALKALGATATENTADVVITAPAIAENGAVVPVTVTSNLPKTESIALLVEKNPNLLAAVFTIPEGTEPHVTTRIKMSESSDVYALVRADGKFYTVAKEIKVTLGGCGG